MKNSVYWFVSCAVLNISYHVSGYVYKFVFVVHFPIKDVMLIKHMFSCSLICRSVEPIRLLFGLELMVLIV